MEYDIYDPSNTVRGDYWQMEHAINEVEYNKWQEIADVINQGFSIREKALFLCTKKEYDRELWGCIRFFGSFWIYRIFLTGRDNIGRPGRYFFLLIRVDSPNKLQYPVVYSIIKHLDMQTTTPLDIYAVKKENISSSSLTAKEFDAFSITYKVLFNKFLSVKENTHCGWIINIGKIVNEYADLSIPVGSHKISSIPVPSVDKSVQSINRTSCDFNDISRNRIGSREKEIGNNAGHCDNKSINIRDFVLYVIIGTLTIGLWWGLIRIGQVESELAMLKSHLLDQQEKASGRENATGQTGGPRTGSSHERMEPNNGNGR